MNKIIPSVEINGVMYVEAKYVQELISEIAGLKEGREVCYIPANELKNIQAAINVSYRNVLDRLAIVK